MKKNNTLIYLALLSLLGFKSFSQTAPQFYQPVSAGGNNGNEIVTSVTGDTTGNVYAVGYFSSSSLTFGSSGISLTNTGTYDMFIAKYNKDGNVIWAHNAIGADADSATSIARDSLGNLFVVGHFNGPSITFGGTTVNNSNPGTNDIFIVKYDAAGTVLWAISEGGSGDDNANDVAIGFNSSIYITGNFTSPTLVLGLTTLTTQGGADIFYAKYDNGGTAQWAKSGGGSSNDFSTAITTDLNGDVYITGSFYSGTLTLEGPIILTNIGTENVYIAKINSSGVLQWAHYAGGSFSDEVTDISADASGDIYITGSYSSNSFTDDNVSFTLANYLVGSHLYDVFIVKYSSSGTVIWAYSVSGAGDEKSNALNTDNCGNVYICGSLNSSTPIAINGNNYSSPSGLTDLFLLKYDDNGTVQWAKTMDGSNHGTAISGSIDDNMVIAGSFDGSSTLLNGTADTLFNSSASGITSDYFLTKVQTTATDVYVTVVSGATPITSGWVWLYARKDSLGLLEYSDSVHLMGSNLAHFSNVLNLNYCVLAKADSSLFPNLIPTYNDNKFMWDSVNTWAHTCSNSDYVTIDMIPSPPMSGSGIISGYVSQTSNYGVGAMSGYGGGTIRTQDPDPNVNIKIRHNPGGSAVAATTTDLNGYYSFVNLDTGSYTVMVDIPGLGRDTMYTVVITPIDTLFLQQNYCADSDLVMICSLPVGIPADKLNPNVEQITIAPNPFSSETIISFTEKQTNTSIKVMNLLGECVQQMTTNEKQLTLDMSGYAKGIYFVIISESPTNKTTKTINKKIVVD